MNGEIQLAPVLRDPPEYRFHLTGGAHIERHHDGSFEFAGERLNEFLCLVIEVRDGELRSERAKGLGAAPCDGVLVRYTDDETSLSFQQLGFDSRNHGG